jgi:hypothetical protein
MVKPLFVTMLTSDYVVQDCSSRRDLHLVVQLVKGGNM